MAPITTPAVILHAFKYGETSKIVRLATRDLGVQSAIAKGALRPKSKFGARIQVLSDGVAQLYVKPTRELQTLGEFDVTKQRAGLARDVPRYAAATALAELILRFAPAEPNPTLYDRLIYELDRLTDASAERLGVVALSALWGMVGALGFAPAVDGCARDGRRLPVGPTAFSVADGGFLCKACAAGRQATTLQPGDRATLEQLIVGNGDTVEPIPARRDAAHRHLLARFVQRHLAEGRELSALTLWETQRWTGTS